MQAIEPLIWELCSSHPDWAEEAKENGAAQHLSTMCEFLNRKLNEEILKEVSK